MENARLREIAFILVMMGGGALVVVKSDQQCVRMLAGMRGKAIEEAESAYRKHLNTASLLLLVIGMGFAAIGIIGWVNGATLSAHSAETLAVLCGALSILLCALGIWGRVRSFRAAAADLNG
ncbi:hypothetical protein [Brevundimonas sp.]